MDIDSVRKWSRKKELMGKTSKVMQPTDSHDYMSALQIGKKHQAVLYLCFSDTH